MTTRAVIGVVALAVVIAVRPVMVGASRRWDTKVRDLIRRLADSSITVETPKALVQQALDGRLSKHALASLLSPESRPLFLEACARIERRYTEACAAAGDPCLESGCSCQGERLRRDRRWPGAHRVRQTSEVL